MNNFQKMAMFFCAGILSVQLLTDLPTHSVLLLCVFACISAYKKARWLSFYLLGFVWAVFYALSLANLQLSKELEGQDILITGEVYGLPSSDGHVTRFILTSEATDKRLPKKIRLNWYGTHHVLRSGETWQLLVKLKRPHGLANPHGFDYEKWLFQQTIGASGYVRSSVSNKRIAEASIWSVAAWRQQIKEYLERSLVDVQQLPVIKALVLGDRSSMSAKQWQVFQRTGTSHLIAISGLHIGLVAGLLFVVMKFISIRMAFINRFAIPLTLLFSFMAAVVYSALAGFSLPTQRALLMLSLVLIGVYWQRHYGALHIILLALVGVLTYDPLAPMSAGFWLSFSAVAVILFAAMGRLHRAKKWVQLVQVQAWVAIGLLPLLVYLFQQVSLVAPLANALAVPWTSFVVVPLLLLAMLLGILNKALSIELLHVVDHLLAYQWYVLSYLSELDFASFSVHDVPIWAGAVAILGSLLLLLPKGFIPKPVALVFFIPLFSPPQQSSLQAGEFKLVLLDVGQGLSAVIHTAKRVLVFDTGAKYNDKSDLASTVITPYLKGEAIERIDALVISHGDNDHAGGTETLLSTFQVNQLYSSVPDKFSAPSTARCQQGLAWHWDGVSFEFISPQKDTVFEGNNASCVLKVNSPNGHLLLTADIEKDVERSLLNYSPEKLTADVLIAPHHGSKTSSTDAFIAQINPRYVLFPVGYRNKFGFPKPEVLARYDERGIQRFNTADHGAISAEFLNNKVVHLTSYRSDHLMFWSWRE